MTSQIVQQLAGHLDSPFLVDAASSARALSGTRGSTHHRGKRCAKECDHGCSSRRSSNQELSVGVGSMRLPRVWNGSTGKKCSSNGCRFETEFGCVRRGPTSVLTKIPHTCSRWSCCVASVFHFLFLRTRAVVASQSTRLATTVLRAPERENWGGGDSHLECRGPQM